MCHISITFYDASQEHSDLYTSHISCAQIESCLLRSGRNHTSLRSSPWGRKFLSPFFVARLQHLLNELQHSAVGNLLSDQGQEFFVIYESEEVLEIRINDPLVSGLYFAPNLGQRIGGLATFTIPKAARIKDLLKDRLQAIDQRLLTHPVVHRGYA